ncbi:unnamed protein product, partial [marine sediment metagenome]
LGKLKSKFVNWLLKDVYLDEIHIGEHSVVVSGTGVNMDGQDITNANSITAIELHGTTYWGDVRLEDVECPVCHRKFKTGDRLVFIVNKVEEKFIAAVPVHLVCDGGQ